MARINEHYLKLKAGYLFPEIGRRVTAFAQANPAAKIIRMGIGDVTEPLPMAITQAMHRAVDDMARRDTFKGYGPEQGYAWLREKIAKVSGLTRPRQRHRQPLLVPALTLPHQPLHPLPKTLHHLHQRPLLVHLALREHAHPCPSRHPKGLVQPRAGRRLGAREPPDPLAPVPPHLRRHSLSVAQVHDQQLHARHALVEHPTQRGAQVHPGPGRDQDRQRRALRDM